MQDDKEFSITIQNFNEGQAPLAHIDSKTFMGNAGQASEMKADILSNPGFLQQSPGLADLTNGSQAGVVSELIRHILDKPTAADITYAIGATKLFRLSSTTVKNDGTPTWPQVVTDMTEGESVIRLKANLYGFFNKSSGGDILKMPLSSEVIDPDWGSSTDVALEDALHPSAAKEDIMVFGNGRYLGVYVEGSATLHVQKLDFGEGAEVADVVFHSSLWWIAVNYGEGRQAQIYLYDGSAISNILSDEAGLGSQEIGFLYVYNGIIYVAYQDKTTGFYALGWLAGRQIKPLRYFAGSLPCHRQKTLYKNTIAFISGQNIMSCGAVVEQLPIQMSILTDGGYATLGGIAAPFGTPLIASTDGGSNFRLAKFSGLSTDSNWKSRFFDISKGSMLGKITKIIVATKALGENARADISIEGNQGALITALPMSITGTNETRHVFSTIDLAAVEDIRVIVSYANGNTTNNCPIRKIILEGMYVERA